MKPRRLSSIACALLLSAAASLSQATVYNISGVMTANTSTIGVAPFSTSSWLILKSYPSSQWVARTIAADQMLAVNIAVTGSLDITGSTINSGTLSIANYSLDVLLGDYAGANMDLVGITQSFGAQYGAAGWAQTAGSVVDGSCKGNFAAYICDGAYAGQPALDYSLIDNGGGLYSLQVRLGTLTNTAGAITTRTFNLQAAPAAVPIPASAWLFGSALLGLAGAKKRRQ